MTGPSRTELHRHLDASFRPVTLADLTQTFHTEPRFVDGAEVRKNFWLTEPLESLEEVLIPFELFPELLRTPDILERVAREAVEDANEEGIGWVEFRYAPAFTGAGGFLSWADALDAFERGLTEGSRRTGVRTGLICIVVRNLGVDAAEATMDFAVANKDRFIAVDLAGAEVGHPCRLFEATFRRAHDHGLPVTIHAGEAGGPENVWEAIDLLGAQRIGHGLTAAHDEALMRRLATDHILVENCPTSNFITGGVVDWAGHPLPVFLEHGIPVSISTDDPAIFGVTLPEEYRRCREWIGLSDADLAKVDEYARRHSFLHARPGVVSAEDRAQT